MEARLRPRRSPSRGGASALGLLVLVPILVLGLPLRAGAQTPAANASAPPALMPPVVFSVVGGLQGTTPEPHVFGGVNVSARLLGASGFELVALLGSGRSYRSTLLAAGPSFRIVDAPGFGLRAWAGPAYYGESLPESEFDANARTLLGFSGGVTVRVPVWRGALTGGIVHWRGSYEDVGFPRNVSMSGSRLMLGVGR